MFERRNMWATTHIRGIFYAKMSIMSQCEAFIAT